MFSMTCNIKKNLCNKINYLIDTKKVIQFNDLRKNKGKFTMNLINPQTYPQL